MDGSLILHPYLDFLVTEGGVDEAGIFHKILRMDDSRLAEILASEVLADLVRKELLSPEWAERLLAWRHTWFSVHIRVRAKTKPEAERVGKYMIRPGLALNRLFFLERQDKGALDQLYFTMDVFCVIPGDWVIFFTHKRRRNHEIRGRAIACDGDIIDHSDSKERFDINIMRMRFHGVPKKYDKIDSALGNHSPELLVPSQRT